MVDVPAAEECEMLTEHDAHILAPYLEPNTSAAMILFENIWASKVADAIVEAEGTVVLNRRIPRAVIDQMLAESLS